MILPIDAEYLTYVAMMRMKVLRKWIYVESTIEKLFQSREQAFSKANDNIDAAQKKQKKLYDCKHLPEELPILEHLIVDKQRKGGKLGLVHTPLL